MLGLKLSQGQCQSHGMHYQKWVDKNKRFITFKTKNVRQKDGYAGFQRNACVNSQQNVKSNQRKGQAQLSEAKEDEC